ncbi:MAG: hypothetical protein ACRD3E_15380 [Terriglobales bacterium]
MSSKDPRDVHGGDLHLEHVEHPETSYDHSDLGSRGIFVFLIGLALTVALVHVIIYGFIRAYEHYTPSGVERTSAIVEPQAQLGPKGDPTLRFPTPVVQPDPVADLNKFREAEELELNSAGWIDQRAGIVHIPIERAIDLVAQRGLPVRPQPPQTQAADFGSGDGSVAGAAGGTEPRGNK